jgi:hypothetical protein
VKTITRDPARVRWFMAVTLLGLAACGPSAESRQRIAELEAASVEKDSLLQEVTLATRMLSDVSAELAKVQVRGRELRIASESPRTAARDTMVQKIRYLVTRVNETDARLRESRRRIDGLTKVSDSLRAALDSTMSNLQQVIESQRAEIAALTGQVGELQVANAQLSDSVTNLATLENTVFYVIGTKEDLVQRGIVVEEGGGRVLFFLWKTGRTLAPARDLDPSQFVAIDRRLTAEIPLPEPTARYRIVSRHDLDYVATPQAEPGRFAGGQALQIAAPEFWRTSKFLIIVQD